MFNFPVQPEFLTSSLFSLFYDDAISLVMPVLAAAAKALSRRRGVRAPPRPRDR
jgi:hypothetical protein